MILIIVFISCIQESYIFSCHQEACHEKCLSLINFRPGARIRVLKTALRSPIQRVNPLILETVFVGVLARAISIIQSEQSYDHTSHAERSRERVKKYLIFYLKAVAMAK